VSAWVHDHGAEVVSDAAAFVPIILADLLGQTANLILVSRQETPMALVIISAQSVSRQALRCVVGGIEGDGKQMPFGGGVGHGFQLSFCLGKVAGHTWAKLWERTTREKERERQHLPFELAQGNKKADGDGSMKPLLGGKGANLAEMTRIGLPVPPASPSPPRSAPTITPTSAPIPKELWAQMEAGIANMEKILMGTSSATPRSPLLVAVRSGARDSMPGMMDTILNLGLNDQTVLAAGATKNERFAWDCYRRFIQMYGDVVMGVQKKRRRGPRAVRNGHRGFQAREISPARHRGHQAHAADLQELVKRFKALVKERTGKEFPNDPWEQLRGAVGAVFGSWMNDRAIVYRRKYNIPTEWGTAVNVQAMVFGNTGDKSGSGVAFTRDPATGEKVFYGEFLINAQGEDVVAGVRTPEPVAKLKKQMPAATRTGRSARRSKSISRTCRTSSSPSRTASCSCSRPATASAPAWPPSAFAVEMVKEKLIDWQTAVSACRPTSWTRCSRRSSTAPPSRSRQGHRHRPARRPRRGHRQDLFQRRPRGRSRRSTRAKRCCSSASRPRPRICAA
jgi:hypothetical protein